MSEAQPYARHDTVGDELAGSPIGDAEPARRLVEAEQSSLTGLPILRGLRFWPDDATLAGACAHIVPARTVLSWFPICCHRFRL